MGKNAQIKLETPSENNSAGSIPALSTKNNAKLASQEAFSILNKKNVPKNVPCQTNKYRKRFLNEYKPYKLPTIVHGTGDWFIKYFYERPDEPGKFKEFRVRDGINYLVDPDQKEKETQQLCRDIKYALEEKNYNPFKKHAIKKEIQEIKEIIASRNKSMTIAEAVTMVIDLKKSKNIGKKSVTEYNWLTNTFEPWCKMQDLERITDPTIDHIELFLAEKLESEEWEPRTYNNKISILTTFFNYLVSKRKMTINPIKPGMLERIGNKAEKNKYYDQETLERILPKVQKQTALRTRIRWTYYTCARGSELRELQIKHIDLKIKKIVIPAESGKTGVHVGKRHIPLCQELYDIIIEEKLNELPPDWYVFGDKGKPGPKRTYNAFFSDIYFEIKKALGLDFKYTIYSFKHTRVVDLLIAGFDPIKVMHITGHTNWGSFQKYIRELGAVMDKQMIGNTLKLNI